MLLGPTYVYKCSNCDNLLQKGSIISGNSIGAKLYSDGKLIARMFPDFPNLTKCKKCDTIFWISKQKEIGEYGWFEGEDSEWSDADNVEFLDIDDYFRALDEKLDENDKENLYIRTQIWWSYNDRTRKGEELFTDKNDEIRWRENCKTLLLILNHKILDQRIMIAELYRNLGEFENCISTIKSIRKRKLKWLKEKFINECKLKNSYVIQLN